MLFKYCIFVGMMTIGMTYGSLGALLVPMAQFSILSDICRISYGVFFFGILVGTLFISVAWQIDGLVYF